MVRKRAPGGGRKPQGEFAGKSENLTTRITPQLREGLEREAARNNASLSQEVERRLRDSLDMPRKLEQTWGPAHVGGLARLISRAVQGIEMSTGRRWCDDPFTGQAAQAAIEILLGRLLPEGKLDVPEEVERSAQALARVAPPDRVEFYRQPDGVGSAVAFGLINQLEMHAEPPPVDHSPNHHFADTFYLMPRIRKDIAFKTNKEGGSK